MPILDQLRTLADTDSLSAGDRIRFIIAAWCPPFGAPTLEQVNCAFQNATAINLISVGGTPSEFLTTGGTVQIDANVTGAIQVGQVRGQILAAAAQMNACKSLPCGTWGLANDEIDLVVEQGTGLSGAVDAIQGGIGSAGMTLSLVSLAVIAVIVFVAVRRI